ncbi:MAG: LptF/LptG family permease [Planctomycetota bacterium]|nr:LptF/LptG family permease [Planctomycetota bacterium]
MKLQAYILRQMLTALLFGVVSIVVLAVPGVAVNAVHKLPAADASLLAAYLPTVLQTLAPYVLPLCFLLAVVGTYGRLAADREWTAIQMAGFHPLGRLLPGLALATVLSGTTWWLFAEQVPGLKADQNALIARGLERTLSNLPPGRTTVEFHGFFLRGAWRDPRNPDIWHDVYMRRAEEAPQDRIDLFAERAHIRTERGALKVDLEGVRAHAPGAGVRSEQGAVGYSIPLAELIDPRGPATSTRPRYKTVSELREQLDVEPDPERRRILVYEVHKRASLSVVYFLFLLLGAPTGLILRRGNQLAALAVSSAYGIGYYALSMNLGAELASHTDLPVLVVAWGPTAAGVLASLPLLRAGLRR